MNALFMRGRRTDATIQPRPFRPFRLFRPAQQRLSIDNLYRPLNPWVVVGLVALAGWSLDTLLVTLEMHGMPGAGFVSHVTHLWYGPPVLVAIVLLLRGRFRVAGIGGVVGVKVKDPPLFQALASSLDPQKLGAARDLLASSTSASLLTYLRKHPTTSLMGPDLAQHVELPPDEVVQTLDGLATLGLVEKRCACDLTFYRLTSDPRLLAQMEQLALWQEQWRAQARRLAEMAGPSLHHDSDPFTERSRTPQSRLSRPH